MPQKIGVPGTVQMTRQRQIETYAKAIGFSGGRVGRLGVSKCCSADATVNIFKVSQDGAFILSDAFTQQFQHEN